MTPKIPGKPKGPSTSVRAQVQKGGRKAVKRSKREQYAPWEAGLIFVLAIVMLILMQTGGH